MDEIIYNSIMTYYNALSKLGYYKYSDVFKLLLLCFYRDFTLHDYRGHLSREDYDEIEKALNCLFGTSCLIPYSNYMKSGKLHIGEVTEIVQRIKDIEETEVLKLEEFSNTDDSDIVVTTENNVD